MKRRVRLPLTITTPKLSDVPTLVKWGKESVTLQACKDDVWYSAKTIRGWITHPKEDLILVAKRGKNIVGMCLAHGMRDWAYCSSLYIHKPYRKQGIGKALLMKTMEILKKRKYSEFALLVKKDNKIAKGFYQKQGFKKGFLFRWLGKKL